MSFVVTPAAGGGVTYAATGSYDSTGQWMDGDGGIEFGAVEYERTFITSPGVDGSGSKTYGARSRRIVAHVVYVNSSPATVLSAFADDTDDFAAGANTIQYYGYSYSRCFLEASECRLGIIKSANAANSKYHARATLVFTQRGF